MIMYNHLINTENAMVVAKSYVKKFGGVGAWPVGRAGGGAWYFAHTMWAVISLKVS